MSGPLSGRRILLYNPPGRVLLRGEGRADALLAKAAVSWIYPPMNLAYGAACLRAAGAEPRIRDYPAEGGSAADFARDLAAFRPDAVVLNVNASSVAEDLASVDAARAAVPRLRTVALAPFLAVVPEGNAPANASAWASRCDAVLTAEYPELLVPLLSLLVEEGPERLDGQVPSVARWDASAGRLARSPAGPMGSLDELPFPARDLLSNGLYVRPDTGLPQAIVQVSRGCPSACTFCLTPSMTGTLFLQRDPSRVVEEARECAGRFGIRQVFFRADTFTMNRRWVLDFCDRLSAAGLGLSWCCNSRADRIDPELAAAMRRSGCWLVSFGFESGSPETLARTRKGTTVERNLEARAVCREAGLRVLGQFIIGFPWEGPAHLEETYRMIRRMRCDFADVQFLVPYPGTPLWAETPPELLRGSPGTKQEGGLAATAGGLSEADLLRWRKRMLRATYLAPGTVLRRLREAAASPRVFANYARLGAKFLSGGYF